MMRGGLLAFGVIAYAIVLAAGSAGDRAPEYRDCLALCDSQRCLLDNERTLSLPLRLTRWTCADDCKYRCMHLVTDVARADRKPVLQYFGKWPFWRFLGMQEPASVVFSLLNLWVHARGFRSVERRLPEGHSIRWYLLLWSMVSMNAWLWSAVFHTRDKPATEKLDYFSAALAILCALHFTVSRFFFIDRPQRRSLFKLWTLLCVLVYLFHVSYLSLLPRFDYSYNIMFNLILGLAHNVLWVIYALPSGLTVIRRFPPLAKPRRYRPHFASKAAACVGLTMAAMSFELLDFPAMGRVLDAHALWHAATVPIAALWYDFLTEDALDEGWRGGKL